MTGMGPIREDKGGGTAGSRTGATGEVGRKTVGCDGRRRGTRPAGGCYGEGDGSPHPRGDGEGRAVREPALRGRLVERLDVTGDEEREGAYGRWGEGMGPRIREDNGWGRPVREPALRCNSRRWGMMGKGNHRGRPYAGRWASVYS